MDNVEAAVNVTGSPENEMYHRMEEVLVGFIDVPLTRAAEVARILAEDYAEDLE